MENIIVKWGSSCYEVDSNRTTEKYNQLIANFINSELFSVDPYNMTDDELNVLLTNRANNEGGYSWIESANKFFSRCFLEKIIHVNDRFPWDQLYFQPWKNFPVITMNRFQREGVVVLDNERKTLPIAKKYEILGCHEDTTQLHYFSQNVGNAFIYCYHFGIHDDYKERWCLRFAEDPFKREALLLTQYFSISYLINHPLACFPVPYLCGSEGGIQDMGAMESLLTPVVKTNLEIMTTLQKRIKDCIRLHKLTEIAEAF